MIRLVGLQEQYLNYLKRCPGGKLRIHSRKEFLRLVDAKHNPIANLQKKVLQELVKMNFLTINGEDYIITQRV